MSRSKSYRQSIVIHAGLDDTQNTRVGELVHERLFLLSLIQEYKDEAFADHQRVVLIPQNHLHYPVLPPIIVSGFICVLR